MKKILFGLISTVISLNMFANEAEKINTLENEKNIKNIDFTEEIEKKASSFKYAKIGTFYYKPAFVGIGYRYHSIANNGFDVSLNGHLDPKALTFQANYLRFWGSDKTVYGGLGATAIVSNLSSDTPILPTINFIIGKELGKKSFLQLNTAMFMFVFPVFQVEYGFKF